MKQLMILLLGALLFGAAGLKEEDPSCQTALEKIAAYYYKHYTSEQLYMKIKTYSIYEGEASMALTTEIWRDGDQFAYRNPFLQVWQDEQHIVLVSQADKSILIRDYEATQQAWGYEAFASMDMGAQLDSLQKLTTGIETEVAGEDGIVRLYLKPVGIGTVDVSRIFLKYDLQTGAMKEGRYIYGDNQKTDVYVYEAFSHEFDRSVLAGSALGKVLRNGQLKDKYKGFELRDLRNVRE